MTQVFVLGLVAVSTYFFLKAIWDYELRIVKEQK